MKILLAVDGSPYTKKMLAYLVTHEHLLGGQAELTALTVHPALPARAKAALGKDIVETYYADETEKVMAPVQKFLGRHGLHLARASKTGRPGEAIAKFADAGRFDLLVMGSHGHGALGNLVMGSVATQVLAQCRVPVLLVR
ncbi:MAG: universal stress protein [Curvibacter sp.]|nr:universal stress protein [Curvibacter sp.]